MKPIMIKFIYKVSEWSYWYCLLLVLVTILKTCYGKQ